MTEKMNPEIKALWVRALRSGEYEQGSSYLARHNGQGKRYCCLGVLCDLAVKAGVQILIQDDGFRIRYDADSATLPAAVMGWAGLESCNPSVGHEEAGSYSLAEYNDGAYSSTDEYADTPPWTFAQIADAIEASL